MTFLAPQNSAFALVGIAGRFPGAPDMDSLWSLLNEGRFAIGPIPADRWDATRQLDPEKHVQAVGGFIEGVDQFDPGFFGISPREAEDIDPQQRLMLEASWTALEDAGIRPETLRGSRTGVYVGASWHDYEILRKERGLHASQHTAVGNALDVIAARLSYFYGLTGPSLTVETGCSSAMVALHLAAKALATGEIDAAFVGGVNLILAPDVSIGLTRFGGLSAKGRCSAFSEEADGFVRGEGVVALYLKRLDQAQADGDRIHAVIAGTGVNNDGGGDSLVTPSPAGQEDLLTTIYTGSGLNPDKLVYVEAHGTGTKVGDPIETGAIGRTLAARRDPSKGPLAIGSVKTNIGHLEATAGLAGLAKAVLAIRHREIPASLHSESLNPAIDFDGLGLEVVRAPKTLPEGSDFLIGVNSFGWGGTNAHAVLAPPPEAVRPVAEEADTTQGPVFLPLSAQNADRLRARAADLAALVAESDLRLDDIAATLAHHRSHFAERAGFVGSDRATLAEALTALAEDRELAGLSDQHAEPQTAKTKGRVAFVFPGQGSQWAGMGAQLIQQSPVFAARIADCAAALRPYVDWDLEALIRGDLGSDWVERVDQVQPALWAMKVALSEVWRAQGIIPDVVVGHSQGEVSAATVAGILSLDDAARIVALRSQIIRRNAGKGGMLSVDMSLEEARAQLEGFEDSISIAVNNGPSSCVLSGDIEALETLQTLLDADEVFNRLVKVDYASHSHHMDEFKEELHGVLVGIEPKAGEVTFFSTVDLEAKAGTDLDPTYWVRNLREPVQFFGAMSALFDDGVTHVIEVSPHRALLPSLQQIAALRDDPAIALSTMQRDRDTVEDVLGMCARAYVAGLMPMGQRPQGALVDLPAYPWQRQSFWAAKARPQGAARKGLEVSLIPSPAEQDAWEGLVDISAEDNPWLADHKVHEATVFPGAGMVALMLAAGRQRFGALPRRLRGVQLLADLTLGEEPRRAALMLRDTLSAGGDVALASLPEGATDWVTHATAIVEQMLPPTAAPICPEALDAADAVTPDDFYAACTARGLSYGDAFRGVTALQVASDEALGQITLPQPCTASARAHGLHPALLDSALQVTLALESAEATVVPVAIDEIRLFIDPEAPITAVSVHARRNGDKRFDLDLFTAEGQPLAAIIGLQLETLVLDTSADADERLHRLAFIPETRREKTEAARVWLIAGSTGAEALAGALTGLGATAALGDAPGEHHTAVAFVAPDAEAGLDAQKAAIMALAQLVRACAAQSQAPRLAVITTQAQAQLYSGIADPGAALFWGFVRVLRREHPELEPIVIDMAPGSEAEVAAELHGWSGDDQVVLAGEIRLVGRLKRGAPDRASEDETVKTAWQLPAQPFRLVSGAAGYYDELEYRPLQRSAPGKGEVEVEISAAALNFIDVMKAMGTYPGLDARSARLGGEFAGIVVAVGEGVTGLTPGERVVGCGFGAFASHATVPSAHVRPIPQGMSDAEAAALPLVMTTAWYGLVDLADLGTGETVLIHSAAGGLGLAAIQVARMLGAEIIATAGSKEKREMLRAMGIEHVFNSRDLSWAEKVREVTKGRGVDVVLNSLTGMAIPLGLEALAEDGRFIEVGKKDIYAGRTINLSAFRKRLSIASVDIAGLMEKRVARFGRLLGDVWAAVADGDLTPLPILPYSFAAAGEALRTMGKGDHIGKFVLTDPASVTNIAPAPFTEGELRGDGTYLITGGLGALGLSLAEHMAARGAGGLALLGRSAAKGEALTRIEALRAQGVAVRSFAVDVSDRAALAEVLAKIRAEMPGLRGVVHAAGLLDDALIDNMTEDQLARVLAPKIDGALALDALTEDDPLDLFVLFSSAAALFGNAGQAAYAAGNAGLDALAEARRARGKPALSVQWGPFADIGLAAADAIRGDRLDERGMGNFSAEDGWLALTRLLQQGETVSGFVPINLRLWFDAYPDTAALPSWSLLLEAARGNTQASNGAQAFRAELEAAPAESRDELAEAKVRELAGRVLRMDPQAIGRETPFKALGLDSLMGLELRNRLEVAFGLKLSPTLLWTYGNTKAIAPVLVERVFEVAA
ncbi:type I polyketide synthase [Paracoccus aminophilus]|uniref:Polyketide synthase n=1 Tax=Paracoccus aminophilus JCM 7686 TaxID=1367847 RepID=S5YCN0_PARAH|nr:type I polyketide synthase [Paracoccus aminophilus]AGT09198.1 polyketide synthase [Paracoccus aminophilus JCM 7686]